MRILNTKPRIGMNEEAEQTGMEEQEQTTQEIKE